MNNEKENLYCGSGKRIKPELFEVVIDYETLKDYVKQSRSGKLYVVCELWERKHMGKYGETHSLKIKTYNGNADSESNG